jgi:hypothetical protein
MKRHAGLLVLLLLAIPASGASLLSDQYTSSWVSSDFFPLGSSQIQIGNVQDETGHEASFDILKYLSEQIGKRLSADGLKVASSDNANAIVVDVSVRLYQEGNIFGRWGGGGAGGAAYAVVQASFRKRDQPIGAELVTVSVIPKGGLYSLGAEKSVLQDVAEEVVSLLQAGSKK